MGTSPMDGALERSGMIPAERHNEILDYIYRNKSAQIKELALRLNVSEATIRRDLDELAGAGKLTRTHGGAVQADGSTSFERIHSEKMQLMRGEKQRIAKAAAALIKNGDTVLLDSGTTTFLLAEALEQFEDLTVITYDLHIADMVNLHPTSSMILTGGTRRGNEYHVLAGGMVDDFIRNINVNIAFLGADAVSEAGVTNANLSEAYTKRLLLQAGRKNVLVTDHSKFGNTALAHVCRVEDVDTVITDSGVDVETKEWLLSTGVQLIIA